MEFGEVELVTHCIVADVSCSFSVIDNCVSDRVGQCLDLQTQWWI